MTRSFYLLGLLLAFLIGGATCFTVMTYHAYDNRDVGGSQPVEQQEGRP